MANNLLDKSSIILTPTAYNNGEALCVKPSDGSGDFDFSRNSAATRVNAQGLVENVQILSSNLVQNGDFSEEGSEEVSNGSFSQEGAELITNGDFSVSGTPDTTSWALGWYSNTNNVEIANGKLTLSNSAIESASRAYATNGVNSNNILTTNKFYKLQYDIVENNGATDLKYYSANGSFISVPSVEVGSYTLYIQNTSNSLFLFQLVTSNASISIDNVSVREVGQDWTLGSQFSIGTNKAIYDNSGSGTLVQSFNWQVGKTYKITFDIGDFTTSQRFDVYSGISFIKSSTVESNTSYTIYFNGDGGSTLRFRGLVTESFSITNISVKEVGQDWIIRNDWSIEAQGVRGVNAGATTDFYQLNVLPNIGMLYRFSFEILEITNGSVELDFNNAGTSQTYNTIGVHTGILNSTGGNGAITFRGVSAFSGLITNISVIEITDDTNLPRINYEGFSYDGSGNVVPDSGCGSWLWEPQTSQLVTYSELFSNAAWLKTGDTVIEGNYTAPDGSSTAYKISGTNGSVFIISALLTTTTRSIYARTVSGTGTAQLLTHNSNTNNLFTITEQWQRFELNTSNATGVENLYAVDFRGSGTLSEVIIWGANATNDQDYATSYIPSNGSQVTRNQDVCTNGGTGTGLINSTEGTLYFEGAALSNDGGDSRISLSNGTLNNRVTFAYSPNPSKAYIIIKMNGISVINDLNLEIGSHLENKKIAISYKSGDTKVFLNGTEIKASTMLFSGATLNDLSFKSANGSVKFYGKTKALAVWKEALSDQELTELTTI